MTPVDLAILALLAITALSVLLSGAGTSSGIRTIVAILALWGLSSAGVMMAIPWKGLSMGAMLVVAGVATSRAGGGEAVGTRGIAWTAATGIVGVIGCAVGAIGRGVVADVGWLVASAVLLPLFPLHGVYTSLTARLPAGAAVMLLVGLPALGFDAAFAVVPRLPPPVQSLVTACALLGAAYGSIKALVQARVTGLISYGGLALLSILWWYAAGGQPGAQTAFLYLAAATLVTAGVRLAWWSMETRYGGIILGQVGGLSRTMPRFAFLLALLVMAATGLPPFGLFSAYMQMLLAMASAGPAMAAAVLSAWLLGSWYWLSLLQRMLFGEPRWDVPYEDVRGAEMAALVVVIVSLLVIGLAPLFGPNGPGSSPSVASHQADRDVEGRL